MTKRLISLVRPAEATIIPTQAELKTATATNSKSLFTEEDNDDILSNSRFQVLGQPATMASVVIPPSINLYVRRGCLVSLHGSPSIALSHEWQNVWFNLTRYASLKPSIFYKLISTTKFDALVAPNFISNRLGPLLGLSSSPFRTLCLLNLDGTVDWNVWGKDSIVAYEENTSLGIRPSKFPLLKANRPIFSTKYQIAQGRGNILLSGSGSVYTIELKDCDDEIIIRSEHLLAMSGSTQLDIKSSVTEQTLAPLQRNDTKLPTEKKSSNEVRDFDFKMFFQITRDILVTVWNWSKSMYSAMLNGPTKFLKIKGPRTLLVQSSYNVYLPASKSNGNINPNLSGPVSLTNQPSKDYLSYVSISKSGEIEFRSTPDFEETVKSVQGKVKG